MFELFVLAIGLSVDTSLASLSIGATVRSSRLRRSVVLAVSFAGFQGLMPILGWTFANYFLSDFQDIDHWIAFVALSGIGLKLIWDSRHPDVSRDLSGKSILMVSVATSVDALVVGASLSFLNVAIVQPSLVIGAVTFLSSLVCFWIGQSIKVFTKSYLEVFGGLLLIFLGAKVLLQHL